MRLNDGAGCRDREKMTTRSTRTRCALLLTGAWLSADLGQDASELEDELDSLEDDEEGASCALRAAIYC